MIDPVPSSYLDPHAGRRRPGAPGQARVGPFGRPPVHRSAVTAGRRRVGFAGLWVRWPLGHSYRKEVTMGDALVTSQRLADGAAIIDVRGELDVTTVSAFRTVLVDTITRQQP